MPESRNAPPLPQATDKLHECARPVHVTYDAFGAVVAEYFFFPAVRVSYLRWRGHVTADALVRVGEVGMHINQQLKPVGMMHDARGTSGEWGEAASWVEFVWMPGIQAHCPNLRVMGFLCDTDTPVPYANTQLLGKLDQQFEFQQFYSLRPAWRWMTQRVMQFQNQPFPADSPAALGVSS